VAIYGHRQHRQCVLKNYKILQVNQCRSRSFKITPGVSSYYLSIVGLKCSVNAIVNVMHWRDLEIWVMGRSRSLKMAPIYRSYTTLYWSAVVTIALSSTILELFDVQNIVTLKYRLGVIEGY